MRTSLSAVSKTTSSSLCSVTAVLYGTTADGGKRGTCFDGCFGTVFELTP